MLRFPAHHGGRNAAVIVAAVLTAAFIGAFGPMYAKPMFAALAVAVALPVGLKAAAQIVTTPTRIVIPVTLFSLVLLRLPVLYTNSAVQLLVLLPFVAAIVALGPASKPRDAVSTFVVGSYAALLVVAFYRGSASGNYLDLRESLIAGCGYVLIAILGARLFATATTSEQRQQRALAVAFAPVVYAWVNIGLLVAHVDTGFADASIAAGSPAELLGLLGFAMPRISFPLSISINHFGVLCGMGLAMCIVMLARARDEVRWQLVALGAAGCVYCLLRSDSRTSLIMALVAGFGVAYLPNLRRLPWVAFIAPIGPVVVLAVLGAIGKTSVGTSLSSEGRDVASGSGREIIWQGVWKYLQEGNLQDIIGYGAAGQITSGASEQYQYFFGTKFVLTAHNVVLQTILDMGYIGALALVATMFFAARGLIQGYLALGGGVMRALPAGIIALILSGLTEAAPTYYSPEALMWFLLAGGAATTLAAATKTAADPARAGQHAQPPRPRSAIYAARPPRRV